MKRLEGKRALITGGTRGIGFAIAAQFVKEGAHVVINGVNKERGEQAKEFLKKEASEEQVIEFLSFDVSKKEEVEKALDLALSEKAFDIVVNNAGITRDQLLMKLKEEDWDSVLNTNLKSAFLITQKCLRSMMKARFGRIINISSVVGLMGNPGQTNYCAAKAGLIGFTKSLAKEVGSRGITVNCIAPGFIETDMTDQLQEKHKESLLSLIPLARMGQVEEIAQAATFLAANGAYITGQVLSVDGGMAM